MQNKRDYDENIVKYMKNKDRTQETRTRRMKELTRKETRSKSDDRNE